MRTVDAVSAVPAASVAATLALFVGVYGGVFGAGIYYIARLVRSGPPDVEGAPRPPSGSRGTPARPLSAPPEPMDAAR